MNKRLTLAVFLTACTVCSCHKIVDLPGYQEPLPIPKCRVASITYEDDFGISKHTVTYNSMGLPDYISEYFKDDLGNELEDINVHQYDERNRLIAEGPFSTPNPYIYHYVYEGESTVPVRDTLYSIGMVYVEDFEYDRQGRIIRVLRRHITPDEGVIKEPDEDRRYYYDLRGNRQEHASNPGYAGIIEYSNKPSLYSLNKVWQLRYRNYSRNATISPSTFNEHGLPVIYKFGERQWFQPFLILWEGAVVSYECE